MIKKVSSLALSVVPFLYVASVQAAGLGEVELNKYKNIRVDQGTTGLGFQIPSFSDILTFAIRGFFIIAGLAALFFLLLGALAWVTSGGNKENVEKAQQKIQQAVVGVILIAVVLAVVATLENVVFNKKVCFGLTCPVTIPSLVN